MDIDPDIGILSRQEAQELLMQHRLNAIKGLQTFETPGNDGCWDDLINGCVSKLLTPKQQRKFKVGDANMTRARFDFNCQRFQDNLEDNGCFLKPNNPKLVEINKKTRD